MDLSATEDDPLAEVWRKSSTPDGLKTMDPSGVPALTIRGCRPDVACNMSRELHCDGSRDECDRIFLEFRQLDDAVTQALRGD